MLLDERISSVAKTCFLQLREFCHIQSFIPKSTAITLAIAFIHFRLDYFYSLFYGLLKNSIDRLQEIQYSVARTVTRTSRSSNITPILKSLYYLPVKYHINFKLCCITQRALSLGEPRYLNFLFAHRLSSHSFRFSSSGPLMSSFFNKMFNGFYFFPYAAPFLCIYLPIMFMRHIHIYLLERILKHIF